MNSNSLTNPSMSPPPSDTLNTPGQASAVSTAPTWLAGERTLVVAIGLVALCAAVVLCLHG